MGMDTVSRFLLEEAQTPSGRFMYRYAACRRTLVRNGSGAGHEVLPRAAGRAVDSVAARHRASTDRHVPAPSGRSFEQIYAQALAAARQ